MVFPDSEENQRLGSREEDQEKIFRISQTTINDQRFSLPPIPHFPPPTIEFSKSTEAKRGTRVTKSNSSCVFPKSRMHCLLPSETLIEDFMILKE